MLDPAAILASACGKDGRRAAALADRCIVAPGSTAGTIQEIHIVLAHSMRECLELDLLGEA